MDTDYQEADSDMECSDNDNECFDVYDYYNVVDDNDMEQVDPSQVDPEYFSYDCLTEVEVEQLLNENVATLSNTLQITPSLAKVLLHGHGWSIANIIMKYRENASNLLISSKIKPPMTPAPTPCSRYEMCPVCVTQHMSEKFYNLSCAHMFCKDCWIMHFEVQIKQGISTAISCMAKDCEVLAPEDFVLKHLIKPNLREKYQQFTFQDHVKSHPQLRFCPGPNCQAIIRSQEPKAKRAVCSQCRTIFCFKYVSVPIFIL